MPTAGAALTVTAASAGVPPASTGSTLSVKAPVGAETFVKLVVVPVRDAAITGPSRFTVIPLVEWQGDLIGEDGKKTCLPSAERCLKNRQDGESIRI